jgi:hypothetical protein
MLCTDTPRSAIEALADEKSRQREVHSERRTLGCTERETSENGIEKRREEKSLNNRSAREVKVPDQHDDRHSNLKRRPVRWRNGYRQTFAKHKRPEVINRGKQTDSNDIHSGMVRWGEEKQCYACIHQERNGQRGSRARMHLGREDGGATCSLIVVFIDFVSRRCKKCPVSQDVNIRNVR